MSSPETGASTVRVMYCLAISAARDLDRHREPVLCSGSRLDRSVPGATKRGVRVRVMVAGVSNDTLVTRYNSVRLYGALLDAGVEFYEYNRTMMHHKIMMIDGLWATVGTSNFDNRSFSHNEESNVSVSDEGVALELVQTFERDLAVCDRVTKGRGSAAACRTGPSRRWRRSCRIRSRPQKARKLRTFRRRNPRTTR